METPFRAHFVKLAATALIFCSLSGCFLDFGPPDDGGPPAGGGEPNVEPTVNSLALSTPEDTAIVIDVLSQSSDSDGTVLAGSLSILTPPANGSLAIDLDAGIIQYTPAADFNGSDIIAFQLCDDGEPPLCAEATITINVTPVNDAPIAANDGYSTPEDTPLIVAATSGVLADDMDPEGLLLTATLISNPANGILTLNTDGSFSYTPNSDFNGTDSFKYRANDALLDSNIATAIITVTAVNDAPDASDNVNSIAEDAIPDTVQGDLAADDTDIEGSVLSISAVNSVVGNVGNPLAGTYGIIIINADGQYIYTLNNSDAAVDALDDGETLTEVFGYTISDGALNGSAQLTITINGANDPPEAIADLGAIAEDAAPNTVNGDVLANDFDVDIDSIAVTEVAGAPGNVGVSVPGAHGDVLIDSDGTFTYTLDNSLLLVQALALGQTVNEVFDYGMSDGDATATSTLTITISGANDAPVANDDVNNAGEDSGIPAMGNVISNDSDIDNGSSLTVSAVNGLAGNVGTAVAGTYGTIIINSSGLYVYTLANNNAAVNALDDGNTLTEVFTYTLSDGAIADNAQLTITIEGANDAPLPVPNFVNIAEDTTSALIGNVLANDTDPDDTLSVSKVLGNADNVGVPVDTLYGQVVITATGAYSYTLDNALTAIQALGAGQHLVDLIFYTAFDGTIGVDSALIITILGANDAPIANNDGPYTVTNGMTLQVKAPGVLSNDSDPDNVSTLTAVLDAGPTNAATFVLNSNGSFVYSHDGSGAGSDTFTYHTVDNQGATSGLATVTIDVQIGPSANDDAYAALIDTPLLVNAADGVIQGGAAGAVMDTGSPVPVLTHYGPVGGPLTTNPGSPFVTANGSVTMSADGGFTYAPNSGFAGLDQFDYRIENSLGSDTATVTMTVNQPPQFTSADNAAFTVGVAGTTFNLTAVGFPISVTFTNTGSALPAGLSLSSDGLLSGTPEPGTGGIHTPQFTASNSVSPDAVQEFTLTINEPPLAANDPSPASPGNKVPGEDPTAYELEVGSSLIVNAANGIMINDRLGFSVAGVTCFGPNRLKVALASTFGRPVEGITDQGGTLTLNADGSFVYLPPSPTFVGSDSFCYRLSNSVGVSHATVSLKVRSTP